MMGNRKSPTGRIVVLLLAGAVSAIWTALLTAPFVNSGLPNILKELCIAVSHPFYITICEDSLKTVLVFLCAYILIVGVLVSSHRNYRRREEYGSAEWGAAGTINRKYASRDPKENKILTQNVSIGLDSKIHQRNLNVLVCGGSGSGKTRFYAKPNIMNANTSFVVLDPKGEILRDTGNLLKEKGY